MKQFHLFHALVPVLILVAHRAVSAVGRGPPRVSSNLRSEASRSSGANTVYQGQSPAEMEEQEELDGNQEQGLDQDNSPAQSPVQMLTQSSVQDSAPTDIVPSVETSFVQNPNGPQLIGTDARDSGSKPSSLPGPVPERQRTQFLSYAEARQPQEVLPEKPHALTNSEASAAVEELAALSSASSILPMVQPEKSLMTSSNIDPQPDPSMAKPFFPAVLPQSVVGSGPALTASSEAGSFHAEPKGNFPAVIKGGTSTCHPPCIQGRGICNDNMCFCKTPYSGTTCQHKMNPYSRVKYPMVVGLSGVAIIFGVLFAQILHGFITSRSEKRLVWLGEGTVRQEVWMPPETGKGRKK